MRSRARWVLGVGAAVLLAAAAAITLLPRHHSAMTLSRVGGQGNPCTCSQRIEP